MKDKKKRKDRNVNFKVTEEFTEMCEELRDKYYINISAYFRDSIVNLYNELKKQEEPK